MDKNGLRQVFYDTLEDWELHGEDKVDIANQAAMFEQVLEEVEDQHVDKEFIDRAYEIYKRYT